jgi:hypothetical protein
MVSLPLSGKHLPCGKSEKEQGLKIKLRCVEGRLSLFAG